MTPRIPRGWVLATERGSGVWVDYVGGGWRAALGGGALLPERTYIRRTDPTVSTDPNEALRLEDEAARIDERKPDHIPDAGRMVADIDVQRYDLEPIDSLGTAYTIGSEPSPTGEACMWDEIAPLLAELATLRERTRRRDAATEPPPEGEWVLGATYGYSRVHPSRRVVVRWVKGYYLDETGVVRHVVSWWPLPPTEEK